jgi:hypothetical protein
MRGSAHSKSPARVCIVRSIADDPGSMIKRRFLILSTTGLLAAGGLAACGSSSSTGATAAAGAAGAGATTPAPAGTPTGRPPAGGPGRMGTAVIGTAFDKAKAAATAKYPGQVEQVLKLSDGSYVVHVISSSGEQHVKLSKTFKITGLAQGRPGGPPPGAAPAASSSSGGTNS